MNAKTSKLIRQYCVTVGVDQGAQKKLWLSTPSDQRHGLRVEMEQKTWSTKCRNWREKLGLVAKEAAEKLGIPFDTYRGWEKGLVPAKFVRSAVAEIMKKVSNGN